MRKSWCGVAKLASDWRKPDGLFVIQPGNIDTFLLPLPVGRLPGVGKVTEEKLAKLGVQAVRDLRTVDLAVLEQHFGGYGRRLHELSFGIITRSHTPGSPPPSCKELAEVALKLRERVDLGPQQRYRLVGVGLSNFQEPEGTAAQPVLFE